MVYTYDDSKTKNLAKSSQVIPYIMGIKFHYISSKNF